MDSEPAPEERQRLTVLLHNDWFSALHIAGRVDDPREAPIVEQSSIVMPLLGLNGERPLSVILELISGYTPTARMTLLVPPEALSKRLLVAAFRTVITTHSAFPSPLGLPNRSRAVSTSDPTALHLSATTVNAAARICTTGTEL